MEEIARINLAIAELERQEIELQVEEALIRQRRDELSQASSELMHALREALVAHRRQTSSVS